MKGKEAILIKRAPLYKILLQSGTRSWVQSPSDKRRGHRKCLWWVDRKCVWSSDEGDPYRDGRRLCPVLRGLMGHHMFHHRVFSHVLYEVRLLGKNNKRRDQHLSTHLRYSTDLKYSTWSSPRCTPCRRSCSSRPWHSWWRVRKGGSAGRQSPSRHGNSWNIWRVCLCCAASGETWAEERKTKSQSHSCVITEAMRKQLMFTCKLDNCVKAFSHPGWAHLYGRSPVWILKEETWYTLKGG